MQIESWLEICRLTWVTIPKIKQMNFQIVKLFQQQLDLLQFPPGIILLNMHTTHIPLAPLPPNGTMVMVNYTWNA